MKTFIVILAGALLSGCAASYSEPVLSTDHPANPSAIESPEPARSETLDLAAADPIVPVQPAPAKGMGQVESGQMHHAPAASEPAGNALYVCPMHPEVTSDQPDQRCPKCGMKLKK